MSEDLIRQKARERHFLEQLLDGRKLENYKIPVPIKAELRKYQQVCLLFTVLPMKMSCFNFLANASEARNTTLKISAINAVKLNILKEGFKFRFVLKQFLFFCRMEWIGWHFWTSTSFMGSCVMIWVWVKPCSPSVFWLAIISSGKPENNFLFHSAALQVKMQDFICRIILLCVCIGLRSTPGQRLPTLALCPP